MYETFDHTADLGLRIKADTLEALFADAATALFSVLVQDLGSVRTSERRHVSLSGDQIDFLLFDWLNELLVLFERDQLLLAEFDVKLDGLKLEADVAGERADPTRHQLDHEVKAITYHGLQVVRDGDGWLAEVIVDI